MAMASSRTKDRVTAYAKAVVSGKEVAGPLVRAAGQRHLDDLKNGEKRGLYFDLDAANRAIRFFETQLTIEGKVEDEYGDEYVDTKPFILHPSQAFKAGSVFGWYRKIKGKGRGRNAKPDRWVRRFKTVYDEEAKGNGKSPFAAGVGWLCFVADGVMSAEVYFAGTKKEQAAIAFRDAVKMRNNSPALRKRVDCSGTDDPLKCWQMAHLPSGSFMKPISKDGAHSGPRPNCAIVDEYHEHKTDDVLGMLKAGFKGKPNPLLVVITNSGSDLKSPCGIMHTFAKSVVTGDYSKGDIAAADSMFVFITGLDEGDDPLNDPSCWRKANPLLGVTITEDYLAEQVAEAKAMVSKQNRVLRLNFNVWTDAADAWITREVWERCERPKMKIEDFFGRKAYAGIDLSFTTDMSAVAIAFPDDDEGYDVFVEYWRPKEGLEAAVDSDKVRYDLWAKDGFINLTPGKVIKLRHLSNRLSWYADNFDLEACAYDAYRHKELADDLADLNVILPLIEHPQGFRRAKMDNPHVHGQKVESPLWMPNSCQELENAIIEERVRVHVNDCLRWNVSSAVVREDPAGTDNWIFDKRRATGRIDGIVAMAMALGSAKFLGEWQPPVSPWEDDNFVLEDLNG